MTFITGPASAPPPLGVTVVKVETAQEMLAAVTSALPADVGVFAAAVADWRMSEAATGKIKKAKGEGPPSLALTENPDILATVSQMSEGRPKLVVGFAAETENVVENATRKRERKGCDWIVANDVSPETGIMGGSENAVTVIDATGSQSWPRVTKDDVARRLAQRISEALG